MPPKPSPAPPAPSAVAPADGSASVRVRPSAPVPVSIVASKSIVMLAEDTAVGQNAEPTLLFDAGVSWRSEPTMDATPFSRQPPAVGSGMVGGGVGGGVDPLSVT